MHPWVRVVFVNEGTQVRNQGVLPSLAVFGGNEESPLQWCLSFRSTSTSHEYKRDCQQSGTKHSTKHGEVRVMSLVQAFRLQGVWSERKDQISSWSVMACVSRCYRPFGQILLGKSASSPGEIADRRKERRKQVADCGRLWPPKADKDKTVDP